MTEIIENDQTGNVQATLNNSLEAASTSNSHTTSNGNEMQAGTSENLEAAPYSASRLVALTNIIQTNFAGSSRDVRNENFQAVPAENSELALTANSVRPTTDMPSFSSASQRLSLNTTVHHSLNKKRRVNLGLPGNPIAQQHSLWMGQFRQIHQIRAETERFENEHMFYYYESRYKALNESAANEKKKFAPLLLLKDDSVTKAIRSLAQCRYILMQGYIFAFYMTPGNNKVIFEENFKNLGYATEKLSALLVEYIQNDPPSHAEIKEKLS